MCSNPTATPLRTLRESTSSDKSKTQERSDMDPRLSHIIAQQPYPLVFVTISGAHLYGFPSPDSDFDLRGMHVLPVNEVIGLDPGTETIEISRKEPGLELDLVTHDVRKFCILLLRKNGYVLEQLYSPLIVRTTPRHD